MQRYTTIALVSAIALSVGILGVYGLSSMPSMLKAQSDTQAMGAVPMLGHVTLTVTDPNGNILAYHQGDNVVVNDAENCLAKKIFNVASNACPNSLNYAYNVIGLGNATSVPTVSKTDTGLSREVTSGPGLGRATAGTTSETDATSGAPVSVVLQQTFTNGGSTNTIDEAGLFNSTTASARGMFAHLSFTGIPLSNGDSLTVKWTVTMGT